jgi:hypothetical protein
LKQENFSGKVTIIEDEAEVGGGALPLQKLPTYCVKVELKGLSSAQIDRALNFKDVTRLWMSSQRKLNDRLSERISGDAERTRQI